MIKLAPLFALGVLAAPALLPAQVAKSGNGYLFRMKFTKGQKQSYKMTSSTTGMGDRAMTVGTTFSMTVKEVKNNQATMTLSTGAMTMNGQAMGQGGQTAEITMDNTGRTVGGGAAGMTGFSGSYPTKPIPVGGTWTADLPSPAGMGTGKMTATYRFVGITNVNGKPAARVNINITGGATGTGEMIINAADGSLMRSSMTLNMKMNNPQGGNPMNLKSKVDVVRV